MPSPTALGIDFGNTNIVVAVHRSSSDGPEVLANEMGNRTTACCIGYDGVSKGVNGKNLSNLPGSSSSSTNFSKGFSVGDASYNMKDRNIKGTLMGFKRFLGKEYEDEDVQEDIKGINVSNVKLVKSESGGEGLAFEIPLENTRKGSDASDAKSEDPTPTAASEASLGDDIYRSPVDLEVLATLVLGKARETAALYLGEKVEQCVISVPGHLSPAQLIQKCAEGAGLTVMRLIKDPVAAMIAYGLDLPQKNSKSKSVISAVVDFGATSTDISIFQTNSETGVIQQLGSSGDSTGCKEFDTLLYDHCIRDLKRKDRKLASTMDERSKIRLREACSSAKKALSASKNASIDCESLVGDLDFNTAVSRAVFEEMIEKSEKLDNLLEIFDEALDSAAEKLNIKNGKEGLNLNYVLLIGGGCNIPIVQEKIKDHIMKEVYPKLNVQFPIKPVEVSSNMGGADLSTQINYNEAVALGCAIQASILVNQGDGEETWGKVKGEEGDDISRDTKQTKSPISILLSNKTSDVIFPVGTAVPCLQKRKVKTATDGTVSIHFTEPKGAKIGLVKGAEDTDDTMEVSFMVDESGVVKVSGSDGKEVVVTK